MKKFKLFAIAALLMGSTSAFAQLASGGFKLSAVDGVKVEITDFADDYVFASDGVVEIPATLANTAGDDFKVIGIADNAFAGLDEELQLKIKGLKIAASVTYIGDYAFANLGNLASVTFGTESATSNLAWIGDYTFANDPMLKSISFANCPKLLYFTNDGTDGGAYTTPFVNYVVNNNGTPDDDTDDFNEPAPNKALTSITLNPGTLDFGLALANIENLATVNIKDTKIRILNGDALSGNKKITALELPAKPVYDWETGELVGSMAVELSQYALRGTCIQTLTINGNVALNGVDELGVPMTVVTAPAVSAPALTTVIFKGDVAAGGIKANAFAGNTKLATLTFEGEVENGAVLATSFTNAGTAATATAGIKMTITALKAEAGAFAQTAFAAAAPEAAYILLKTNKDYADVITDNATIYGVKKEASLPVPDKIYVESNDDKTFYAKFKAPANTAISKGLGDVVVYSAYVDESNIYMDPLYSVKDKYVVANGQAVIVKVKGTSKLLKTDDKGKYIESGAAAGTDAVTMRYDVGSDIVNAIIQSDKIKNQDIITAAPDGTEPYAVAKISTNGLKWKAISADGTFYINDAFYLYVKKAAGGRVNVIWLDENGNVESEATAIQSIATKSENEDGAIYNVAGQKVNASYKGLVIKNGKKYMK